MSRHVCTNMLFHHVDDTEAYCTTYLVLYFADDDPERDMSHTDCLQKLGEYQDHFVNTGDGWRFKRREVVINFMRKPDRAGG